MSDGGKGSNRRPQAVSDTSFVDSWNQIFGKTKLQQRLERERALEELARINQELGLYEDYDKITRNNLETQEVKR